MTKPTPSLRERVRGKLVYIFNKRRAYNEEYWNPYFDAILDLIVAEQKALLERLRMPEIDDEIFDQAVASFNMAIDDELRRLHD